MVKMILIFIFKFVKILNIIVIYIFFILKETYEGIQISKRIISNLNDINKW